MALIRSFLNTCADSEKEQSLTTAVPKMFSNPAEVRNLLQPVSLGWRQGCCHSDRGSRRR